MDGSNVDPNALELCWRISRHIIDKILKDPEVDIDLFKIPLQNHLRSLQYDDELDYDLDGFDDGFDYDSVPVDIREEIVMVVDEQGNIEPTVKLRKDDEIGGLHWV